ncbi:MAG: glycosyltransferase family 1 protein, partial [Pseudomonadota bacterium]|nr:glycosyltransferase family 1 protein [Pseudomonadota bacterium]
MKTPSNINATSKDLISAINGDRPLKILLPSYRSNPFTGGQGIYMRLISKAIVDLGHEVDVISG